jgi:hypothetical protein
MTSIRIAITAALVLLVAFAGGAAHTSHGQAHASAHAVALASASARYSPPLCC